jgi:hypothetical protein
VCDEMSISLDGIFTEKDYGDIIELIGLENQIVIFTESAIFTLDVLGECFDFCLKKVSTPCLNIKIGSVKKIGDYIYFYSKNTLYKYENGKVKEQLSVLDNGYAVFFCMHEFYLLGYNTGHDYTAINVLTNEVLSLEKYADITPNGYAVLGNRIYEISKKNTGESLGEITVDMDSAQTKAITKIEILTSHLTTIKVMGDFGEREYSTSENANILRNLISKKFRIMVLDTKIVPEKIAITYRIYGE